MKKQYMNPDFSVKAIVESEAIGNVSDPDAGMKVGAGAGGTYSWEDLFE